MEKIRQKWRVLASAGILGLILVAAVLVEDPSVYTIENVPDRLEKGHTPNTQKEGNRPDQR